MPLKSLRNRSRAGLDRIFFEQLEFTPGPNCTAGSSIVDDGVRYIYAMLPYNATSATFWRFDTWWGSWQQLATPPTTTITVGQIIFAESFGTQRNGQVYGSILSFQANGTAAYLYKYDIATNAWSALSITNVPAAFGTDACLCYPEARQNNYEGGYHANALKQVTTSAAAAVNAVTMSVTALPVALIIGTVLDFGKLNISLTADAPIGTNELTITALTNDIAAGTVLRSTSGFRVIVRTAYTAGGTTLNIYPIKRKLDAGDVLWRRIKAVLTAAAAAAATSITVSALLVSVPSASVSQYYNSLFLVGHGVSQMYRYQFNTNTWSTTSENSGNPALAAWIVHTSGSGACWLPNFFLDRIYLFKGSTTLLAIGYYDMQANTFTALTYYPNTELFSTGSCYCPRSVNGKNSTVLMYKEATGRFYEFNPVTLDITPYATAWQYPDGAAAQGTKITCMTTPDNIETLFFKQSGNTSFLRGICIDA